MIDLTLLHPELVAKIGRVLTAMQANHTPMKIYSGRRTTAEQMALWAKGRTLKGQIVTYCDGLKVRSQHQDGRAVDCCFLGPDPFGESHPWGLYADLAVKEGLIAGAHWTRPDRSHVELPADDPKVLKA